MIEPQPIDKSPLAPIRLVKPNGQEIPYGLGVTTAAARGTQAVAAKNAASAGDVIKVDADITVTSNLAKHLVNWEFATGVTVTRNDNAAGCIFSDGGSAMTMHVSGKAKFVRQLSAAAPGTTDGIGIVLTSHADSVMTVNCDEMHWLLDYAGVNDSTRNAGIACLNGTQTINGNLFYASDTNCGGGTTFGINWINGEQNLIFNRVVHYTDGTSAPYFVWSGVDSAPTGDFRLIANHIESNSTTHYAITTTGSNADAAFWVIANTVKGIVEAGGANRNYLLTQKVIGSIRVLSNGKFWLRTDKIGGDFASATPYVTVLNSGFVALDVSQFEPGTNATALVAVAGAGAEVYVRTMKAVAATGQNAFVCSSGQLHMLGGRVTSDSDKLDLQRSGGTLTVYPGFHYDSAKTSGTITKGSLWGITPTADVLGILAAADYSAMRTLLGLVIGTNVQAYDADLTTWAGITPGTGVGTALGVNVGSAGAPVLFNGAGGTPSSITLTNGTGLPPAGVTGTAAILGANTFTAAQTITGGTVSSSTPIISGTQTWNNGAGTFNGILANFTKTAIAADTTSFPLNVQVGGTPMFSVNARGDCISGRYFGIGTGAALGVAGGADRIGFYGAAASSAAASDCYMILNAHGASEVILRSGWAWSWSSSSGDPVNNVSDTKVKRPAAGVVSVEGASSAGGTMLFTPLSPAQITANQDNYNPGGRSKYLRLSSDASRDITGLTFTTTQVTGEEHVIVNVGAQNIVLKHDVTSTAANRFSCSTAADITLSGGQAADLWYDGTTSRWRVYKRN